MTKTISISLILIHVLLVNYAQSKLPALDNYIAEVRSGRYGAIPHGLMNPQNPSALLEAVKVYQSDTVQVVRSKINAILRSVGLGAKEKVIRLQAVNQLIHGARDNDSGNVGEVFSYLTEFKMDDFSPAAGDSLRSLLNEDILYKDQLIRIIGFVNVPDTHQNLMDLTKEGTPVKERWSAHLALARMGDETMINNVMTRVRKMKVNDNVVYEILPDLVYMRQPAGIDYLIHLLNSDEKNCESPDPERDAMIPCAYRIMEMLAPFIEDYPLALDPSGDIKTKNYTKALITVRKWFSQRGNNYKIIKDMY